MRPLFVDVDTQNDFVLPAGSLYAPGAERVIPKVEALNRLAAERQLGLISTACAHEENDAEFLAWPPHCVKGTVGQLKPNSTLVGVGQILFEKQHTDVFLDTRFVPLLNEMGATEYVVFGVVTEVCVRFAAEGLLRMGKPVTIVGDAVCALSEPAAQNFLERFIQAGGRVCDSAEIRIRF